MPADEYELAKKRASYLGISLAEFVRGAISDELARGEQSPWMHFAGFVESLDSKSSQSIDDVVYGLRG